MPGYKFGKKSRSIRVKIFLLSMPVLFLLLPISPVLMPHTYRDSGVFLYIGTRILEGELPYRDIWDHKPPLIFLINAIGLAITPGSRWGVWGLEFLFLLTTFLISSKLLKRHFGQLPALFALGLLCFGLIPLLQGGNLTTEYGLPLQFITFSLGERLLTRSTPKEHGKLHFILGICLAALFFLKQSTIGIVLVVLALNFITDITDSQWPGWLWNQFFNWLLLLAGFSLLSVPILLFFWSQGALTDFIDQAFFYNLFYAGSSGILPRLMALYLSLRVLVHSGLALLAPAGWIAGLLQERKLETSGRYSPIIRITQIDFLVELFVMSLTGRFFPHYALALLPASVILAANFFSWFFRHPAGSVWVTGTGIKKFRSGFSILLTFAFVLVFTWGIRNYVRMVYIYQNRTDQEVITYIQRTTNPEDTLLVLGAEAHVNFFANRKSPTRYVYQLPFWTPGYGSEEKVEEFLQDILQDPPKLIIDTLGVGINTNPFPVQSEQIEQAFYDLGELYQHQERIGNWEIYRYSPR